MLSLAVYFIGWPGIMASLILLGTGLYTRRTGLVILGAVFAGPISWYLGSTPMFRYIMYFLPVLLIGSALAIRFGKIKITWLLAIPYAGTIVWLAFSVLRQN